MSFTSSLWVLVEVITRQCVVVRQSVHYKIKGNFRFLNDSPQITTIEFGMKDELQYFLKIILISFVSGQAFPNRQFVGDPPQPLTFMGNQRFFSEAEMSPYSRPPRPMMYRDEEPQTPILYRQDNVPSPLGPPVGPPMGPPVGPPIGPPVGSPMGPSVGPPMEPPVGPPIGPPVGPPIGPPVGPPLIRNFGFQPQPIYYGEEDLQSPSVFFRENLVRAKPNFYREEEVSPPKPVLYQQPSFQPIGPEVYREEPIQQNPMIYREENLFPQSPTFQPKDRYRTSSQTFGEEAKEPQTAAQPYSETHSLPQTNQNNSKPKSQWTKNRGKNCHPSILSPLKMNIEPSKENFNTLRTALRIPLKEPAQDISDRDKVLPTIIIQEDAKSQAKDKDNHKMYLEDDYSDHYVDDSPSSLPEPTLPNYPYQYFQPVKLCKSNKMIQTTSPSTPCFSSFKNDLENIIPVLRSPITILPSRFPPGIEQIIEKIQRYFSTYNQLESNQRPVTKPSTPHTSTSTHSPPPSNELNAVVTKPTIEPSSNSPNVASVSLSTVPTQTNQTFSLEISTPSKLEKPVQLLESISEKPNAETPPVTTSTLINGPQTQALPQNPTATETKFDIIKDSSGFVTIEDQKPISTLQTSTESTPETLRTIQPSLASPQPQQDTLMNEIGPNDEEPSAVFSSTSMKTETIEIVDEIETTTTRSESTTNNCKAKITDDINSPVSGDHKEDETTTAAATNTTTC